MLSLESTSSHDSNMFRLLANNRTLQRNIAQNLSKLTQESKPAVNLVSTRHFKQDLPRLPVPTLIQTLDKYYKSVIPFLNEDELKETERKLKDFLKEGGTGLKLQKLLEERARGSENWLSDWWLNAAYLAYRDPCVIFSNPGQAQPFANFKNEEDRFQYTASVILGALEYKGKIDRDEIPEEKMGNAPLDMQQYKKAFGTCRIPGEKVDSLQYNSSTKHVAVVHNNHWFRIDVLDTHGKPLSKTQLIKALKAIIAASPHRTEDAIGVLTSENRDTWGRVYKVITSDRTNASSIADIQSSIAVLCLDQPMDKRSGENQKTLAGRQLVHGGGSAYNTGNRWFDKTIQFVIGVDGTCGLCYEHSPAEGGPVAVLTDYVVNYANNDTGKQIPDAECNSEPIRLPFNITPEVRKHIENAKKNIDKLIVNLEMYCFSYTKYGKEFIKTQKVSPDSYIQMALQYTFYRIHKTPPGHYESAGLRKYIHGRTETIRSTSIESITFAKAMLDSKKSAAEKVDALKKAIDSHKKYTVDAINGYGCDRHLLGLKLLAMEKGVKLPSLYSDASFKRSTHMRISSSQVPAICDGFMCYAPLVSDGYGACYNLRKNEINFGLSAFVEDPTTSAVNWGKQLENSLNDMHELLAKMQKAKL